LLVLFVLSGALLLAAPMASAANPSANLDQCANDPLPSSHLDGCNASATQWVNGNLGASKSVYFEGDSIPYRLTFDNLALASHTVTIEWDTTKSSKHAIDYLRTYNASVADANPCLGVANCNAGTFSTFAIPGDPQVAGGGVTQKAGVFTLYGGTITNVSAYTYSTGAGFVGDKSAGLTITFTASRANPVLAWGGHIATRQDWGANNSAVAISGSPYHTRLLNLDGSGGNQDRSLSADAVIFPSHVTVIKHADVPSSTAFNFTATGLTPATFSLTDNSASTDPQQTFGDIITFDAKSVAETSPLPGYRLGSIVCTQTGGSAPTTTVNAGGAGGTASVSLVEGQDVTCTFNNLAQNPALSITKDATETSYNAVGQTIHYNIVATNTGNTTLAAVTITDANATLGTCTPANGSSLAPGGTITCPATHVVTQADIDAGSYLNTACVDDGAGGATQVCDDATVPSLQNPHLAITKVAGAGTYNAVGQTITWTVVATNDGNVSLHNVLVTDANASLSGCAPSNPADLVPGGTITCTASHTITQADVDAGHYLNTACANDGPGGAAEVCADSDVNIGQNPSLAVDKTSTTTLITAVGQVVPYSYVVTNTGNVTLTGVTLADDKVPAANITCNPAQPATLAPNGTMTCTGSHTVTQAEFDAGGNLTNIATADSDQTGPTTDTVSIPFQPPVKGHIMHTGVTCSNFVSNNPSDELTNGNYSVKSGKVNQVDPGVMFYYISITAPSASFTINVTQSNDKGWKPIPDSGLNQIILYESNCSKSSKGTSSHNTTTGTTTLTVSGATVGATYVVGVKYSLSGLSGQPVSSPFPTVTYSFATNFNGGSNIASSGDTIVLSPK
jgi:uncharacterized repeat protein (TIGR01451 family)